MMIIRSVFRILSATLGMLFIVVFVSLWNVSNGTMDKVSSASGVLLGLMMCYYAIVGTRKKDNYRKAKDTTV
nr:hypothetical protein [uncultured bacterium]